MNNQRAIRILKLERDDWETSHCSPFVRKEAFNMAISALQAQEAKTQLSAEGTTSDLISRQDAIEVIEEMQMPIMRSMFPEEQFVFKGMSEALSAIKDLPSAHPEIEERKEESAQNVPKEDLISRKAAIDAIAACTVYGDSDELEEAVMQGNDWNRWSGGVLEALEAVKELPSAEPEIVRCKDCKFYSLTNKETKTGICNLTMHQNFGDDWFCAGAERRTDEGD